MPAGARAGIGLLIMGGIIVGLGQYFERGAWSLFGVATVASVTTSGLSLSANFALVNMDVRVVRSPIDG